MKIRDRLSLQFTFIFAVMLAVLLTTIYLLVVHHQRKSFFDKLDERAKTAAQFYLAEDNLSVESFSKVLRNYPRSLSQETIRIYNEAGQSVFIKPDSLGWKRAIIRRVIKEKNIRFTDGERQAAGIYYTDNSGNFVVIAAARDINGRQHLHQLGWIMLSGFALSLLVTGFLGRIFARMALQPISRINNEVKIIRATSLNSRLPVSNAPHEEVNELSLTINQLLEHLEQSFEAQRSFIANASHELRTPIASILGEAEITLMQERNHQEYQTTLQTIIEDAGRLNNIINSLLELVQANIDSHDMQPINMQELLWEVVDEWGNKPAGGPVKLAYNFGDNPSKVTIQGNRYLLFIALSNIVKNAIKFSDNREVSCELTTAGKHTVIIIRDQGIGIPDKETDKIFQPFYRGSNAMSYGGFGIGLSLAHKIVKLHQGSIVITSTMHKGTSFSLLFPC
ncbi:sensor histidine kinase [Chitinophaga nivalis]|uniref:histidine kinase n=1 Tax=Chitinophaga nivalis TaxID=2991709 RepID=A0ABT3ISV6_9BACT|nr:HAMP domain-containing sensor histidine kinase [Chitinophaga nivalis]MCW3463521.1 HAMP domain-containing histidine kinase [Chitinophaga nivalis]MCW3486789.1 HAMP domain-containing histidine kinase [Chitinophaga nivalis]